MKYLALPTWLLYRLLVSFNCTHPCLSRDMTLEEWAHGETELCVKFDMVFWGAIASVVVFAGFILFQHLLG